MECDSSKFLLHKNSQIQLFVIGYVYDSSKMTHELELFQVRPTLKDLTEDKDVDVVFFADLALTRKAKESASQVRAF